ncbi:MAG: tetratricopeptide repeat protein [Thermoanaerobaculia bacterium]|jgi:tetratricopeptide (TPR) repeat protein
MVIDLPTSPRSVRESRAGFPLLASVAALLIAFAYANSLKNEFHFDDSHVIVNNVFIRSLGNTPLFFTDAHTFSSLPQNATYRPLVTLSYAIDYAAGRGLDPTMFHVTQIALLLALWGLLLPFYIRLLDLAAPAAANRFIALASATLFAAHTANTETMNFISCRSELISAIGLLGAFLLVQRSAVARRYHLYLLPLVFGALAKAPVVVFAPLLMVYVFLFTEEPRSWARALRSALPSLVTGVALLWFLNSMNAREWVSGGGSKLHYAITQPFVWLHYARLFFLPIGLTADTDWRPFEHWYDTRAIVGFVFVVALLAAIRRLGLVRERRAIAFGLAWFAIALAPTSSVFPLAEVANEHRIFFPYIGLTFAVVHGGWLVARRLAGRPARSARAVELAAGLAMALIIVVHVVGTRTRNETWRTEESLWRDTAEKSPGNGRALMNYGLTQMAAGRHAIAKSYFERALVLTPNYSTLQINLAIVDGALGQKETAEQHFRAAIRLKDDFDGNYFLARWLAQSGRAPEAVAYLRAAFARGPGTPDARSLAMRLAAARGAASELATLARQSLAFDPDDAAAAAYAAGRAPFPVARDDYSAWFELGAQKTGSGNDLDAAIAYRQALRFDPRSADALNNLGWSLAKLGFKLEARDAFTQAIALRPEFDLARRNLLWLESLR